MIILLTIFLKIVRGTIAATDRLDAWAHKPRVRLLPFYFAKSENNPDIKNYRAHIKEANLQDFPRYRFEEEFYDLIKQDAQFIRVKARYLAGYFHCQEEGIEEPEADVVAMWELKNKGSHIQKCYVFFVDDTYYAGDVVHDTRPEWVLKNTHKRFDATFYIRLLYKIRENVAPDGTGPRTEGKRA